MKNFISQKWQLGIGKTSKVGETGHPDYYEELDEALRIWSSSTGKRKDIPITGLILMEKASFFYDLSLFWQAVYISLDFVRSTVPAVLLSLVKHYDDYADYDAPAERKSFKKRKEKFQKGPVSIVDIVDRGI